MAEQKKLVDEYISENPNSTTWDERDLKMMESHPLVYYGHATSRVNALLALAILEAFPSRDLAEQGLHDIFYGIGEA
jgi:hypothetical protein